MGRPDMGRNKDGLWAGLQRDLQQVPGIQAQNGSPVGMDVSDGLQLPRQDIGRLQGGQQDQAVDLPRSAVFLIDGTDLPRGHKARLDLRGSVLPKTDVLPQRIEPLLRRDQLLHELGPPSRVGEIPGPHQRNALPSGPEIQVFRHTVPAGGSGVFGVDMQIGDQHGDHPPHGSFFSSYPFFAFPARAGQREVGVA